MTGVVDAALFGVAVLLGILAVKTENEFVFAAAAVLCGLCVSAGLML